MASSGEQTTNQKHLGIPEALFIEDVEKFMKEQGTTSVEGILKKLDENYQKYKLMETNLAQKKRRLKSQIPDLQSTLDIVKHMHSRKVGYKLMLNRADYINSVAICIYVYMQGVFYCVRSLIELPAFISYPILVINPSFSSGDEAQSNEVSIIIVSFRRVEL